MAALKYLSLLLIGLGLWLVTKVLYREISAWWAVRIEAYAQWMGSEFESMFEEMSLDRARRVITFVVLGAFSLGFLLAYGIVGRLLLGMCFALLGYFGPRFVIVYWKRQRLNIIDNQLVDVLVLMGNALKAGMNLQQSVELVVREMKPPIADEFGRVVKAIQLGRLTDDALKQLAERVPLPDLKLAVESILTLRETGGDLSETFHVIANTIVERKKVEGKISAMTAQGMTQGVVTFLMPILFLVLFTLVDREYTRPLFVTPLGWIMLITVFLLESIGLFLMFRLVKIKV